MRTTIYYDTTPETWGKAGPPENLRPIILFSLLHEILALIMIKRISEKTLK